MNCKEIEPILFLVRKGEINAEEQKQIDIHLATCINCKRIYDSTVLMTKIVKQQFYEQGVENNKANAEDIIRLIRTRQVKSKSASIRYRQMPLIKSLAASLLILIISALVYQEADFYHQKRAMKIPLQRVEDVSSANSGESDCLKMLKRKYKLNSLSFGSLDKAIIMNKIDREQLAQYIEQVCGSETGDISTVKKLLIQAGLIKSNIYNEIKK